MKLLVVALCLLFTFSASARWRFNFDPEVATKGQYYLIKYTGCPSSTRSDDCITNYNLNFRLGINSRLRYNRLLTFKVDFQGYFDINNEPARTYSLGSIFTNSEDRSKFFNQEYEYGDFRELYSQVNIPLSEDSLGPLNIKVGRQLFNWGVAEGFNPLDVINSSRYYDLLDVQKLGANAISIQLPSETWDLELVYLPFRRKSQLPRENSRWLPREAFQNETVRSGNINARIIIDKDTGYQYAGTDYALNNALKNNFGGRFRIKLFNTDFSFVYFEGVDATPTTVVGTTLIALSTAIVDGDLVNSELSTNGNPLILAPVYFRRRTIGGSFVFNLLGNIIRYETAYKTTNYNPAQDETRGGLPEVVRTVVLPGYTWESVLGIERNFSLFGESITTLAQATYIDHEVEPGNSSFGAMFNKAGMFGVLWTPNENWNVATSFVFDFNAGSGLLNLWNISYIIMNGLTADAKLAFLEGKETSADDPESITPIGTYRKNDSITLGLTYRF